MLSPFIPSLHVPSSTPYLLRRNRMGRMTMRRRRRVGTWKGPRVVWSFSSGHVTTFLSLLPPFVSCHSATLLSTHLRRTRSGGRIEGRETDDTSGRTEVGKGREMEGFPRSSVGLCRHSHVLSLPVGRSFTRFFVSLRLSLHLTHFSRRYGGKGEAG